MLNGLEPTVRFGIGESHPEPLDGIFSVACHKCDGCGTNSLFRMVEERGDQLRLGVLALPGRLRDGYPHVYRLVFEEHHTPLEQLQFIGLGEQVEALHPLGGTFRHQGVEDPLFVRTDCGGFFVRPEGFVWCHRDADGPERFRVDPDLAEVIGYPLAGEGQQLGRGEGRFRVLLEPILDPLVQSKDPGIPTAYALV